MCQLLFCPMDDKTFGILQFCVPNKDASVCCFWTDVTGLAEPLCSSYLALKIIWNKIRIDQQQNFSNTFASLVTFAAWTCQRAGSVSGCQMSHSGGKKGADAEQSKHEETRCYSSPLSPHKAEQLWRFPLLGILLLPAARGRKQRALSFSSPPAPLLINKPHGATRGNLVSRHQNTFMYLTVRRSAMNHSTITATGSSQLTTAGRGGGFTAVWMGGS